VGWVIRVWGFDSWWGLEIFLFSTMFRPTLEPTQPPIQWILGALSPGVKWLGHEADHSLPSSAKVKNMWCFTSIPVYLHGVMLSLAQGKLYLYFAMVTSVIRD
jgi:hypothetical protein